MKNCGSLLSPYFLKARVSLEESGPAPSVGGDTWFHCAACKAFPGLAASDLGLSSSDQQRARATSEKAGATASSRWEQQAWKWGEGSLLKMRQIQKR